MQFKVIISLDAQDDIFQASDYYYKIHPSIADKFENELDSFFNILERSPYFDIRYGDYRALPLDIFPYLLLFRIDDDLHEVEIKAVFHTSQNPEKYP
jgi:plasmid stabilization system protein ParE